MSVRQVLGIVAGIALGLLGSPSRVDAAAYSVYYRSNATSPWVYYQGAASKPAADSVVTELKDLGSQLRFEQLPPDVVHHAKRVLLDSLGCALGGYILRDAQIARDTLREVAGRGPATVMGTGQRIDPVSAAFVNALMVRCLDYNDVYWRQDPSHPSTILPAALACAE
ncbi:MAG: MmgE/PrpD family protein [Gemmataceae bacterium]|nr:MmgE/PrpD family protein [Gemmataceae bacterium]